MVWGGWTQGSHQAALGEFRRSSRPSPPRLWSLPAALALTSFYRLILATVLCVLCPPSLSLHLSLNGTLGRRSLFTLPPTPPTMSSFYTCVCGRLPLVSRGEFSRRAQTEGLFQLCLHKGLTFCLLTRSHAGLVRWCAARLNRCRCNDWTSEVIFVLNSMHALLFNEAPSHNTATVISHQVGSQT